VTDFQEFAALARHRMPVVTQILVDAVRRMKTMPEKEFGAAWKEAFEGH